jgi:hypothetical protein
VTHPRRGLVALSTSVVVALVLLGGCGDDDPGAADPTSSVGTTSPDDPTGGLSASPTAGSGGRITAELRQSSHDTARNQMELVLTNDTAGDVTPTRIVYRDLRMGGPIEGERLRTIPAGSLRGYTLALPRRPRCDGAARSASAAVVVHHDGGVSRLRVADSTTVVPRFLDTRCDELALAAAADVRWSDEVPVTGDGEDSTATLTMLVRPTAADHELVIEEVLESHLFGSVAAGRGWRPAARIGQHRPTTRLPLPIQPSRCDEHAFIEGGNATAFRVRYTLDGRPGLVLLRMTPTGAGRLIDYGLARCGHGPGA